MDLWFLLMFSFFIDRSQNVEIEEDSFEDNPIFLKIKFLKVHPKFNTYGQKRYKIIKDRKKNEQLYLYFKQMNDTGLKHKTKSIGRVLLTTHLNVLDPSVPTWKFDRRVIWTTPDKAGPKKKPLVVFYKG
ncbi:uncharacterized protein [Choristoneura fumiferana]|uniref:uncharacterized protein n=1 Tax=Choristoneura fumiferana TaxID=7141 RepID=UPI003D157397